jgi:transposase InsO family protein
VSSISGFQYYLVLVDDFSHYCWTFSLRHKSEVHTHIVNFVAYAQTQFSLPIRCFQADNGTEFVNNATTTFLAALGVLLRTSCPYTSAQNGKAERMLRTLNNTVRTLLIHASMPPSYWAEALATAVVLLNRRPSTSINNDIPYHRLYHKLPDYSMLRVFGCLCYPNLSATTPHKLAPRSSACVFLGYPSSQKGYRCLDLSTRRVIISRHVMFDETKFPFATAKSPSDSLDFLVQDRSTVLPLSTDNTRPRSSTAAQPDLADLDPAIIWHGPARPIPAPADFTPATQAANGLQLAPASSTPPTCHQPAAVGEQRLPASVHRSSSSQITTGRQSVAAGAQRPGAQRLPAGVH